ncbi:MAG TPA: CCA tRNA nucleotidyltransferase [Devosia sp.]|nr:CCA tRNA nucleotidyltransferase [Devosia sp.]
MTAGPFTDRLKTAGWLMRAETQALLGLLDGADGRTRAVGGIVRDTLLNRIRPDADIDLATDLTPDEVVLRAERGGASVYPTGIEHGTVTVRLGGLVAEVTTLREDIETDGRRAVVKFGRDWVRDAQRRDFTLNALYAGMDGTLFDPLGGLDDCLAGRVRFIGDPVQRIEEDRLRVYRFFRFSASHGGERFDEAGLAACRTFAGKLDAVSAERVGAEFRRMLMLPRIATTLRTMQAAGIVGLPDETLRQLGAYERRARRPEMAARLALVIVKTGAKRLKAQWRLSNDDIATAEAVLDAARLMQDFRLNEAAYRHPAALADGVEVAAVIAGWTDAGRLAVMEQLQALDVPSFPISGGDLLGLGMQPGKALGAELGRLEKAWIDSGFVLTKGALLEMARA